MKHRNGKYIDYKLLTFKNSMYKMYVYKQQINVAANTHSKFKIGVSKLYNNKSTSLL